MRRKISIVISLFNEEESVGNLNESLFPVLTELNDIDFEVIWVNDGSRDRTSFVIDKIVQGYSVKNIEHLKIDFSRNFGHEAAMICGIDHASGDAIICMDADGQHPPSEIPGMISAFLEGNDYVLMSRIHREDNGFFKKYLSLLFYKFINLLSDIPFEKNASDFFLISNKIASILKKNYREKNRFLRGFIQSMGYTGCVINFSAPRRVYGESHYSYKKLFKLAFSAIFTFSFKPLRISILFTFVFIFLTIFLSIFSFYQYIHSETIPSGYTTIILFMSFAFTLLFFILSIHFMYFEKLIEETRQTPIYIIQNVKKYAR